jgi:outer membrane protein assembly factor BamA
MSSTAISYSVFRLSNAWCFLSVLFFAFEVGAVDILPSVKARNVKEEVKRLPDIPADEILEQAGAVVGEIVFDNQNIFATESPEEDVGLFRLANRLHIRTKQAAIADQLLFHTGEVYSRQKLEESERLLRTRRYLADINIYPFAYHDGVVDVRVHTRDVWTLQPGISFGRSGGANTSGIRIEEANLLGYGKQFSLDYSSEVDRKTTILDYRDPQLLGSWWTLSTQLGKNSDGSKKAVTIERPFYALDTRWSAGASFLDENRTNSIYELGKIVDEYRVTQRGATLYKGWSDGLENSWTRRWSAGMTYDANQFEPSQKLLSLGFAPASRKLTYPWLRYELIEDQYRKLENLDQIGRTEDVSLGWHTSAQIGLASKSYGADRNALIWTSSLSRGEKPSESEIIEVNAGLSGRAEGGRLQNAMVTFSTHYYWRHSPRRLSFLSLQTDVGHHLDADQQLTLGGDNGLRGYPLRYQAGSGRWLFTAEQRFFSDWYPFRLFHVGGAIFFDMGRTWGDNPLGSRSLGLLQDVGVGLRIGQSRSGLGNVTHINLAFPLSASGDIKKMQFVVETKRSF